MPNNKSINLSKTIWIISGIILISSIAYFVFIYISNIYLSPYGMYLKAENNNFKKYATQFKNALNDFYNSQKPYMDNTYKKRIEISPNLGVLMGNSGNSQLMLNIFNVVNNSTLIFEYNNNYKAKESLTDFSFQLRKNALLDVSIYSSNNKIGFDAPIIFPDLQYSFDYDKIDSVYDQFGMPVKPKVIPGPVRIADTIKYCGNKQFDDIFEEYGTLLKNIIKKEDVKFGSITPIQVGETVIKGQEIIITIPKEKSQKLFFELTKKFSEDSKLIQLTYENYSDIIKLCNDSAIFELIYQIAQSGYIKLSDSSKSFINSINSGKNIPAFKNFVLDLGEKTLFDKDIVITLVIDPKFNILSRSMVLSFSTASNNRYSVYQNSKCNDIDNENFSNIFFGLHWTVLNSDNQTKQQGFTINSSSNSPGKSNILFEYTGNEGGKAKFEIESYENVEQTSKDPLYPKRENIKLKLNIKGRPMSPEDTFNGSYSSETTCNNKLKTKNIITNISLDSFAPSIQLYESKIRLTIKSQHTLNSTFNMPDIGVAKTINLDKLSPSEFEEAKSDMKQSIKRFILNLLFNNGN